MLYSINDFDFGMQRKVENLYTLGYFAQMIGPTPCSMIKRLNFTIQFPSKEWSRVLFAALPYFSNLQQCTIMIWTTGNKQRVLRELIVCFLDFWVEWLLNHKNMINVIWPAWPLALHMQDIWDCFDANVVRRWAGLPYQSTLDIRLIEDCLNLFPDDLQRSPFFPLKVPWPPHLR